MKKIFSLLLCLVLAFSASAQSFLNVKNSININISENFSLDEKKAIIDGLFYWDKCFSEKIGFEKNEIFFIEKSILEDNSYGDAVYKLDKINNSIVEFTINVNKNKVFDFNQLKLVIAHEFGHILGMPHNLNKKSVMFINSKMLSQEPDIENDIKICLHKKAYDEILMY